MSDHDEAADAATAEKATERLSFFSDAVIAIAITLLAIELPVPTGDTSEQIIASFFEISGEYLTFLISFLVIANHWMAHHRLFRFVNRSDGAVMRLNILWLLLIVLNPFLTKVLNEGSIGLARFSLYAVAQAVQVLIYAAMVALIARRGWFTANAPRSFRERGYLPTVYLAIGFLVSVPAFILIHSWAYAIWALLPNLLGFIGRRAGLAKARP